MRKITVMAAIFTFGLWTGGIFAPNQTPASNDAPASLAAPTDSLEVQQTAQTHEKNPPQEKVTRGQR